MADTAGGDCSTYPATTACGAADGAGFVAAVECCVCGGGMDGTPVPVAAEDNLALPMDDCNTYVIYPTSEKDHHFDWTPTNTKDATNFSCTKICGMLLVDTIEFRLDDPDFVDYKYTNDDDNCVLRVDGWEIEWYLGPGNVSDDSQTTGFVEGTSVIDVWFSRETGMAHICINEFTD